MKRKQKKQQPKPIVCYVFIGDRGLTWWQTNWPQDMFDCGLTEEEVAIRTKTAIGLGIVVKNEDPNEEHEI